MVYTVAEISKVLGLHKNTVYGKLNQKGLSNDGKLIALSLKEVTPFFEAERERLEKEIEKRQKALENIKKALEGD